MEEMNPMLREQLYKDGYVMCYPGMKTRKVSTFPHELDAPITDNGNLPVVNDDRRPFVTPDT